MTPTELLKKMTYENAKQEEEAQKYIVLKGIVQYQRVIDYCKLQNVLPTYTEVSALYRYDKRLRDKLYIYLATVEEFMRACIGNEYEDKETSLVKTKSFVKKQKKYCSVSLTLEQLTLKELIDMVLKNKDVFKGIYSFATLDVNLNALRIFRNKISHHNFLLRETYAMCSVDNVTDNTLKHNIKNLQNLLPKKFRRGFVVTINDCTEGLELYGKEILLT